LSILEKKLEKKESKIKFGTDGWRGVIADDFTYNNLGKLAVRVAEYISSRGNKVAVGYDNRFLSPEYASFFSAILSKNNVEVDLSESPVPTPAVSRRVNTTKSSLGIMITASHNPSEYNGIKIKEKYGGSARAGLLNVIVESINETEFDAGADRYNYEGDKNNWAKDYKKVISSQLPGGNLNIAVAYMLGTGYPYFKDILESKGYSHYGLRENRDPIFSGANPEPVPANLKELSLYVKESSADIGFGFDGDADRIAVIAEDGQYHSMQRVLAVLAYNIVKSGGKGRLIKTVAGTTLIDKICKDFNTSFSVVPIGFKNICPEMLKGDVLVAGEESGGLGFGDYLPERDSEYSAARILKLISESGKLFGELWEEVKETYGDSYYLREDFEISGGLSKIEILKKIRKRIDKTEFPFKVRDVSDIDGIRINSKDGGWLLMRPSGTEPLIRIYAEGATRETAERLIKIGRELVL
jgi:phosphomannomutase